MRYGKPSYLLLFLSLLGCNSDTSDSLTTENVAPSQQNLHALNGIGSVRLNTTEQIDLSPFIIKNTSENVEITHIDNLNSTGCPDIAPSNLSFEIYSDTLGRCDYRYHVINAAGEKDSAIYSVLTSNDGLSTLPTISLNEKIELDLDNPTAKTFTLDLAQHLDRDTLEGLEINPDTLRAEFSPSIASTDSVYEVKADRLDAHTIHFTTPNELGWFYITYTLRQVAGESQEINADSKAGYIFINITNNDAPEIKQPRCNISEAIEGNEKVNFDLEKITFNGAPLIEDNDAPSTGEDDPVLTWQLSYVFSPNGAEVLAKKPESETNKIFTFHAPVGSYDIIYTVSDHQNGFALGMMKINVTKEGQKRGPFSCTP